MTNKEATRKYSYVVKGASISFVSPLDEHVSRRPEELKKIQELYKNIVFIITTLQMFLDNDLSEEITSFEENRKELLAKLQSMQEMEIDVPKDALATFKSFSFDGKISKDAILLACWNIIDMYIPV